MELITKEQREKLLENGRAQAQDADHDPAPVLKWFTPDAQCTWLVTELDPQDEDRAFGLCDLGFGCPELGWIHVPEIRDLRGALGLPVERDLYIDFYAPLSVYADAARMKGRIVTSKTDLQAAGWIESQPRTLEEAEAMDTLSVPVSELIEADDWTARAAAARRDGVLIDGPEVRECRTVYRADAGAVVKGGVRRAINDLEQALEFAREIEKRETSECVPADAMCDLDTLRGLVNDAAFEVGSAFDRLEDSEAS